MKSIAITSVPGFDEWREASRECLSQHIAPEDIIWKSVHTLQEDLFGDMGENAEKKKVQRNHTIPKPVLTLIKYALCHTDDSKFSLCYRVLWRVVYENKKLIQLKTDGDVIQLYAMAKAVKRDAYKMSAFLRFREVKLAGQEHFVAWYEPEHFSLEINLSFFQTRFKNMRWSILTPYRAAHWDTETLVLEDNPDSSAAPDEDRIEKYWLTYYANIFNPARIKTNAMLNQMPKKYWKNMPETSLIGDMIKQSDARVRKMISNED
ncbi:TIGR03915 family putative DNA repair protein [Alteromonas sp. S015]|uniref:TIGR03915 family putative DNA repair protein n=1 Tax=Alteromonas sp. S015 TaxID=3117401 RepID=UPI002FDFD75E